VTVRPRAAYAGVMMMPASRACASGSLALLLACTPPPAAAPSAGVTTATAAPTATPTPTATPAPTETSTATPAPTETPTATPTATPGPPRAPDEKRIALAVDEGLKDAAKCEIDRALRGRTFPVTITVTNDGHLHVEVHAINLSRPDDDFEELWAAPRDPCIAEQFKFLTVPAFDGPKVVVKRRLEMR
jgi:hypothetical protein